MRGVYAGRTRMIAAHTRMYATHSRMIATPAQDIDAPLLNKCQIDAVCSISVCAHKPGIRRPIQFLQYSYAIFNNCEYMSSVYICFTM